MGQIGSFGSLIFETSDEKVLTPANLKQDLSGQWATHKVIGSKPQLEFGGANGRKIRFKIVLDVNLGVKPRTQIDLIEWMLENGYVDYLVIGNRIIGIHRFAITAMSETWDAVYAHGELAKATLDITIEEYV